MNFEINILLFPRMNKILNAVERTLNSGDPEIRTWFLIRHNYLPFLLCGGYILFSTYIGPAIMKSRKPFHLRKQMIFYNFSLVVIYTICLLIVLWNCQHLTLKQFCKEEKVKKGDVTYLMTTIFWILYIMKYVEYLDTVFFVLRKKEKLITFLHVAHHASVPIIMWLLFRTENSGTTGVPVGLNALEHIIMYSYYGLAAMGPAIRKHLWWKKYVTQFQMIQFFLIITYVLVMAPLLGCKVGRFNYILNVSFPIFCLYLFYHLYKKPFEEDEFGLKEE